MMIPDHPQIVQLGSWAPLIEAIQTRTPEPQGTALDLARTIETAPEDLAPPSVDPVAAWAIFWGAWISTTVAAQLDHVHAATLWIRYARTVGWVSLDLAEPPASVTLYRGTVPSGVLGLSWTTSPLYAEIYARQQEEHTGGRADVWTLTATADNLLQHGSGWGGLDEFVVDTTSLTPRRAGRPLRELHGDDLAELALGAAREDGAVA